MAHVEQTIQPGTVSQAPVTVNRVPVYVGGLPIAKVQDSLYAQSADAHSLIAGSGAAINAGQVANAPAIAIGETSIAWGDGAVAIGKGVSAGVNAARDGCVCIGDGISVDSKNAIHMGSALAFGGAFCDTVAIGTQTGTTVGQNGVVIGTSTAAQVSGVAIGDTASAGEPWGVAIGYHATTPNSGNGTGSKCIAIGYQATAGVSSPGDSSAIAIGRNSAANGQQSIAIGDGAAVSPAATIGSIAIGPGATSTRSREMMIGNNTNGPITLVTISPGAATVARIRNIGTAGVAISNAANNADLFLVDESSSAGDCRMWVWDVSGTTTGLKRVTFGANDSGGAGFKYLRVAN